MGSFKPRKHYEISGLERWLLAVWRVADKEPGRTGMTRKLPSWGVRGGSWPQGQLIGCIRGSCQGVAVTAWGEDGSQVCGMAERSVSV